MKKNMKTVIHLLKQQNEQLNRMGQNIDELNNKVDNKIEQQLDMLTAVKKVLLFF